MINTPHEYKRKIGPKRLKRPPSFGALALGDRFFGKKVIIMRLNTSAMQTDFPD
jgi:hypothetical protein